MTGMHCMVCHDPNSFRMKVNDARNINIHLEQTLSKYGHIYQMKKSDNIRDFSFDHAHQHFMCGHCPKVNESELRKEEEKLDDNLLKLCNLIKTENVDVTDYHSTLRLLSGHYPGKYRALERVWQKEK